MSKTYILSIVFGFILFVMVYYYWNNKTIEKFEGENTDVIDTDDIKTQIPLEITEEEAARLIGGLQTLFATITSSTAPKTVKYSEDVSKIPNNNYLAYYLSSFSDYTNYGSNQANYVPDTQKWYNHISDSQPFTLTTNDSLPISIKPPNGLQTKNVRLEGPPSHSLINNNFELTQFTFSFFVNIPKITFTNGNIIELFRVGVEAPNYYLQITMEQDATIIDNVKLVIILGKQTDRYSVSIPKTTMESNGSNVLISIAYNKSETPVPKIYFYIGSNSIFSAQINTTDGLPALKLGNSSIYINYSRTLDVKLYAFMYFKNAINADIQKDIISYFARQLSGIDVIIQNINKLAVNQIAEINSILSTQSTSLQNITKELEQCRFIEKGYREEKEKKAVDKWQIKMEGYTAVSNEDIQKCIILRIPNPYQESEKTISTPPISKNNISSGSNVIVTSSNIPFQINTPNNTSAPDTVLSNFKDSIVNYFK